MLLATTREFTLWTSGRQRPGTCGLWLISAWSQHLRCISWIAPSIHQFLSTACNWSWWWLPRIRHPLWASNLWARRVLPQVPLNCLGLSNQRPGRDFPSPPLGLQGSAGGETLAAREITASSLTAVSSVNNCVRKCHSDKDNFFYEIQSSISRFFPRKWKTIWRFYTIFTFHNPITGVESVTKEGDIETK